MAPALRMVLALVLAALSMTALASGWLGDHPAVLHMLPILGALQLLNYRAYRQAARRRP